MKKILRTSSFRFATPRLLTIAFTLLGFGAALVLSSCGPSADRARDEGQAPTEAGLMGSLEAEPADQDSTPMVVRRIWGGPDVDLFGSVSPDGRFLSFIDWDSGNIAVREISTGEMRLVTHDGSTSVSYESSEEGPVFSPDGRFLCYDWVIEDADIPNELRIVGLEGSGARTLYRDESVVYNKCEAWSPDGQHVVALQARKDGTRQAVLVSVADGAVSPLGMPGADWSSHVSFSPDGRHIVYDKLGRSEGERDIFVLELNGGHETALVEHPANDFVLGWAPNGRQVLFASDRAGSLGAWLLPIADGKPTGEAQLVKPDLWRVISLGFAQDGSFYYGVDLSELNVYVATLDEEGDLLAAPTVVSGNRYGHDRFCDWSPDGDFLLYYSHAVAPDGQDAYSIHSVETGETRLLVPDLNFFLYARWSPDGSSLIVPGRDRRDQPGVFKVDLQTGDADPLPAFGPQLPFGKIIDVSPDGGKVYFTRATEEGIRIAVMDLESGRETVLSDEHPGGGLDPVELSADGLFIAFTTDDGNLHRLMVMPSAGGETRELHRFESEDSWTQSIAWSSDGRSLFFNAQGQLWRLDVNGGLPEHVAEGGQAHLRVHPDGRRIAFTRSIDVKEVWVMENFLPDQADAGMSR